MSLQDSERKLHVAERKLGDMKTQYEKLCSTFQGLWLLRLNYLAPLVVILALSLVVSPYSLTL